MTGPGEPTPSGGDEIPESVLRELKTVFADPDDDALIPAPSDPAAPDSGPIDPVFAGSADSSGPKIVRIVDPELVAPVDVVEPSGRRARRKAKKERKAREKAAKRILGDDPGASGGLGSPPGTDGAGSSNTIVIGGDDELPDALYLDDVGEERLREIHGTEPRRGGETIVLGDELEASGAFDAVAVPSRSMDPRVRARRIAVKRAAGRKRLVWAGAVLLVVALVVGTLAVFSSTLFAVEEVRVQGATYTEYYDAQELQSIVDEMMGEPILLVDTLKAEERLEQIAWIERAIVSTDFPHSVLIDVRERQPLAAFRGSSDGMYRIIDRDGRVLDVLDGRPADYMLIDGQAPDPARGELAGGPWAEAAQMVGALPAEIRSLTMSVSVDAGSRDLGLLLQPNVEVRIGGFDGLDTKLARLLQVIRDGLLGIVRVDVSTPEVSVTRG